MVDEMSTRRKVEYDGKQWHGYVSFGGDCEMTKEIEQAIDSAEEAKAALVFMLVAFNGSFKIPVGYFLSNGLKADTRSNFIEQCLTLCEKEKKVVSLTFDCTSTNYAMANADPKVDFPPPANKTNKVYVCIPRSQPCH